MRKISILYLFAFLMVELQVRAQIPLAPSSIQTPNIASLGLFGEIPVSYFSGLPHVEVP
jgi:hypothetical protein